jgi:predicted metal-dependent hydrolase
MTDATDHAITVRRMRFEYPPGVGPMIFPGQPEESYLIVGLSLLLPYLEPYLVRSMHQAKPLVTDAALAKDVDGFNAQEGQHYRQHIAFNEAIAVPGSEKIRELEAALDADYKRWSRERPLRWNLAYAEGFEAFTSAVALFAFQEGMLDRLHPACRDLFAWHLIEELEHRTVAFDVYDHVCGGYFYRLFVGLFAQWHLHRFVLQAADVMLNADPVAFRQEFGGVLQRWKRTWPRLCRVGTRLLPKVLRTYLPWYTPHRIAMPPAARALAAHYAEQAPLERMSPAIP